MNQTASNIYDTCRKYEGQTKEVAWNPLRKVWETVYGEDEVPEGQSITLYWLKSETRYVTIPQ